MLLGECDVEEITVQEVKCRVELLCSNVNVSEQSLWWRGYVLDDDSQTLRRACVGVNEGEMIDPSLESLVLFLTVPLEKYTVDEPQRPLDHVRSSSFDLLWAKHERSSASNQSTGNCNII